MPSWRPIQLRRNHLYDKSNQLLLLVSCIAIITGFCCCFRYLTPVNETLYAGVAWDMWTHKHILVPIINGHTYNQKPPLFFWLIQLGWYFFGVNRWWTILLPSLCSIGSLLFTIQITKALLPKRKNNSIIAAWVLAGMTYWSYYAPRVRLDQLLTLCIMLSLYGLIRALQQKRYGWILFGIGNGLGLLTKGPICFIFTLTPALLATLLLTKLVQHPAHWLRNLGGSLLISLSIAALWAIPIIITHPVYAKSILWQQTASRLLRTHEVQIKSWLYYLLRLPLLIMPWPLWPALWRKINIKSNPYITWLTLSIITIFCILSFGIAQKGSRFLLPLMPLIAILFTLIIDPNQTKTATKQVPLITCLSLSSVLIYYIIGTPLMSPNYNMTTIGNYLQHAQAQHHPILFIGRYDDRFQFPGHLTQPISESKIQDINDIKKLQEDSKKIQQWKNEHPNGLIIQTKPKKSTLDSSEHPLYQQPYRHKQQIQIWPASSSCCIL